MTEQHNLPVRHMTDDHHAPYAIARYLDALKLNGWCEVLMLWLGQYDGLEQYLEPSDNPPIAVRELLARYVANGQRIFPKTIAADLAALPFLHYRAKLMGGTQTLWDPLETSFIDFAQDEVAVWRGETPIPDTDVTKATLLSMLMRAQMPELRPSDSTQH